MEKYEKLQSESQHIITMKIEVSRIKAITQAMEKASSKKGVSNQFKQLVSHQGRALRGQAYRFIYSDNLEFDGNDVPLCSQVIRFKELLRPLTIFAEDEIFNIFFGTYIKELGEIIDGLEYVLNNYYGIECE